MWFQYLGASPETYEYGSMCRIMCVPFLPTFLARRLLCSDSLRLSFRFFVIQFLVRGVTAFIPHDTTRATHVSVDCKTSRRKILSTTQVTAFQSPSAPRGCRPSVRVLPPCLDFILSPVNSSGATAEYHVCDDAGSSLDGESGSTQQPPSSFFEDRREDQPRNLGNATAGQDGADGDRQLAGHRQGDGHQEPGECALRAQGCYLQDVLSWRCCC